jgi:hypothetical protein
MENVNSVFINDIVKDFQYPTFGIETDQKVFVLMLGKVNLILKNPVGKGATNIRLVDVVPKGGLAELNISAQHIRILPQTEQKYKVHAKVASRSARYRICQAVLGGGLFVILP